MTKVGEVIYAWVAENPEPEGDGILAVNFGDGFTPLVAFRRDLVEKLRPFAFAAASEKGIPVKLVEYSSPKELERLTGSMKFEEL